jgi:very-short-patch-repair endonuclease
MWDILRDRRLEGIKFRRQKPIRIYVADFYCAELKLVVELYGDVHIDPRQAAHDKNRDAYLSSLGCTILRFPNRDVFDNREAVLTKILDTVRQLRDLRIQQIPAPAFPLSSSAGEGARG